MENKKPTREEIFGEDDLSSRAIYAFSELRDVKIKGIGDKRADDTFTYRRFDGRTGEYTIGTLMECDEFVDFVMGYKSMPVENPSESYKQGQESVRK